MIVSIWQDFNINMYDYLFCELAYPSSVFLCCFSFFCDDRLLVGVYVVAVSEAPLEDVRHLLG